MLGIRVKTIFQQQQQKKIGYILYHRKGDTMLNHMFSKLKDQEFWGNTDSPSAFQLFLFLPRRIIIKKGVKFDL